jgi:UDP-N-acetyl-D-mannosaminuronic acid dehydrogenase
MKIVEPGVEDLVYQAMKNGTFKVSEIPEEADAYIICVPTPITQENKVDLTHIYEALESILPYLKKGNVIIIESTIPPMTTSVDISHYLQAKGFEEGDLLLAHCPERAFPGQLLHELIHNDRLIGGVTEEATEKAVAIYKKFVKGEIVKTDSATAEMVKLMENTYRDVNIALANELVKISEKLHLNATKVIEDCIH